MRRMIISRLRMVTVPNRNNEHVVDEFLRNCELVLGAKVSKNTDSNEFAVRTSSPDLWNIELLCAVLTYGSFVLGLQCNFVQRPRTATYVHILQSDWIDAVSRKIYHLARKASLDGRNRASVPYNELEMAYSTPLTEVDRVLTKAGSKQSFSEIIENAFKTTPIPNGRLKIIDETSGVTEISDEVSNFFERMQLRPWAHYCITGPNTDKFATPNKGDRRS